MQLDDNLKNLLRELGHAINDTVSESERITGAIAGVRAHGYDIVLKLDATIGLAKRDGSAPEPTSLTTQDKRFLESLRIQVDQESFEQEPTRSTIAEQGGRDWGPSNHVITENVLRGMYAYWRKIMEV